MDDPKQCPHCGLHWCDCRQRLHETAWLSEDRFWVIDWSRPVSEIRRAVRELMEWRKSS